MAPKKKPKPNSKPKKKSKPTKPKPRTKHKFQIIGRVSTKSVHKHTKKHWDEWLKILDKAGARNMDHQEIVRILKTKYRLSTWWRQGVTIGYELYIGQRIEGRNLKGEYGCTATKTLPINRQALWDFLTSEEGQALWLRPLTLIDSFEAKAQFEVEGGYFGEIRTLKAPERMRLKWQDTEWPKASIVNLGIAPRAGEKSILYFMHDSLATPRIREQMRAMWKQRLEDVREAIAARLIS